MISRITSSMLTKNYMSDLNRNLNHMQKVQNQLSSGKEIRRPSDDPYKASRSMRLYTEIDSNKQYNENIKDISNWLDITDTALGQVTNVLNRMRELTVSSGDATYGDDERKAVQDEIKEKVKELSQILNTNFDGAYIFGGTKSTSKPTMIDDNGNIKLSDKDGKAVTLPMVSTTNADLSIIGTSLDKDGKLTVEIYDSSTNTTSTGTLDFSTNPPTANGMNGFGTADYDNIETIAQINSGLRVEISTGVFVDYNKTAIDVLTYKNNDGNIVNVMDVFSNLIENLEPGNYDPDVTGNTLTEIDNIISNVLQKRSEVGAMSNRMESAESKNEAETLSIKDILSKTEDIDFAEKMIEYSIMQTVYTASLQISAKVLPQTILDYL